MNMDENRYEINIWFGRFRNNKPETLPHRWVRTQRRWPINSFVAFDVETSTPKRNSICQIGLVLVENGRITQSINEYVQPPGNEYSTNHHFPHKIKPEMTAGKQFFPDVWETISPYFKNNLVIAHNASNFDLYCVLSTLHHYGIEMPEVEYECTYEITRMRLGAACRCYDIKLINHHDAIFDAEACAELFLKLQSGHQPDLSKITKRKLVIPEGAPDPQNPFYGKCVLFTGKLYETERDDAARFVEWMGARVTKSITSKTSLVVLGDNPGPSKLQKIDDLNEKGCGIEVIDEDEFYRMIGQE